MSHLTIGTSKIPAKPPRGQPPCTEPYVKGANVLKDPGVELQLATFGGGPGGDDIPLSDGTGATDGYPFTWPGGSAGPARSYWVTEPSAVPVANRWKISSANPRSGTYHLRKTMASDGTGGNEYLYLSQLHLCGGIPSDGTTYDFCTAKVEPGDYVRMGLWVETDDITDTPKLIFGFTYVTPALGLFDVGNSDVYSATLDLATSYTYHEVSGFVPVGAQYIFGNLFVYKPSETVETSVDIDDVVLEVS